MRHLFFDRDARLLLVGQGLSLFGDRAMYLVLGIWVKTLTGSNTQAGLVFFVLAIPGLIAPAFGLLVDRVRKRPLMITVDLVVALVLGALVFVHDQSDVWIIYAVTFVYGASGYLFTSAQSALLTQMLPEDRLADANAVLQTASEGSRLIVTQANGGPAVAIYNPADDGYEPWAIVVLEMSDGAITGLHHFIYPELFAEFGLPPRLDREDAGQPDELQQRA